MIAGLLWALALGLVVNLVHAAAQLLACRFLDVAVDRVSLGVGPTLWSRKRGLTTVRLAALPLPLVVRLRAPWRPGAERVWPPANPADLRSKRAPVRLAVFASGPAAVLALALVLAYGLHSHPHARPDGTIIGEVAPQMPADLAGVRPGDVIVAINGTATGSWSDVVGLVGATAGPVALRLRRGDTELSVETTPRLSPDGDRRVIGIAPRLVTVPPVHPIRRWGAAATTVVFSAGDLLTGVRSYVVGGDILVAGAPAAIQSAEVRTGPSGWLAATYGVVLCLWWCLVWPYLDGRRLLFLGVEAIVRKPLHPRYEQWFNRIWLAVLVGIDGVATIEGFRRVLI